MRSVYIARVGPRKLSANRWLYEVAPSPRTSAITVIAQSPSLYERATLPEAIPPLSEPASYVSYQYYLFLTMKYHTFMV